MTLQAPFPWFGGKSRVASLVWERFGPVQNYVEPFFGSGAVLLGCPNPARTETVNDKDGYVANFWRSVAADPEAVAHFVDWPVNENDLHARHAWLVAQKERFVSRLEGDPDFYDPKIAGWWCWGLCSWIGGGWCSGKGPWAQVDVELVLEGCGSGISRQLPHLTSRGMGINRPLPDIGNSGMGVNRKCNIVLDWLRLLSERLRDVRVCCGDWSRVCGFSPTTKIGLTGVFLDPPYSAASNRGESVYADDDLEISHDVARWAIERGEDPLMRIALCGYEGEHEFPASWKAVAWKAVGGYGSQGTGQGRDNSARERVWFSPHCLFSETLPLFEMEEAS